MAAVRQGTAPASKPEVARAFVLAALEDLVEAARSARRPAGRGGTWRPVLARDAGAAVSAGGVAPRGAADLDGHGDREIPAPAHGGFDFAAQPSLDAKQVRDLAACHEVANGDALLIQGPRVWFIVPIWLSPYKAKVF